MSIDPTAFIHPLAFVCGDASLGARASVWPFAVIRADGDAIVVGEESNVQDGAILHADPGVPCTVGARVTIGHRAIVHGATVEDDCLIGMGAIVLNGARIGTGEEAWSAAADLSNELNIVHTTKRYQRVLSLPSPKYADLWTAAKAMYKTEPVVEDGGEELDFLLVALAELFDGAVAVFGDVELLEPVVEFLEDGGFLGAAELGEKEQLVLNLHLGIEAAFFREVAEAAAGEIGYGGAIPGDGAGILANDVEDLVAAMREFRRVAAGRGAQGLYVFATEAMRSAGNHKAVLKRIKSETGVVVDLISPQREAELSLSGVLLDTREAHPNLLFEVGGGSAQIARIANGEMMDEESLPLGTGRILAETGLKNPCPPDAFGVATRLIQERLDACTSKGSEHIAVTRLTQPVRRGRSGVACDRDFEISLRDESPVGRRNRFFPFSRRPSGSDRQ